MTFQLMRHQSDAVDFVVANRGVCAFFHEVGTGKTLSALSTFTALRAAAPKMLVICPLSLIYGAWTREIEKFTNYTWAYLHDGNIEDGRKADISLINFESFVSQKKFERIKSLLKDTGPWTCVIDESSRIKNHAAITTKRILSIKSLFQHRIVMSGTPAPNCEWEYWPQMFFLDESILGPNFYKFKNTHFSFSRGNENISGQIMNRMTIFKLAQKGFKYKIIPEKRVEMFSRMKPWCHLARAEECIDLPEEVDEYRYVEMSDSQKRIYKSMDTSYFAELSGGTDVVANIALTKLMKLRQITSGFTIDDRNNAITVTEGNPKLDALMDIVEECGDKQMIIWANFHWEITAIAERLTKVAGVSYLYGDISVTRRREELDNFLNGTNRFLIANPHSAGHGLTLINCHIAVFFSLDYSMEGYSQARGRIYRNGQKNHCLYFHILAKKTIDENVLAIVQRKETVQEFVNKYLAR